MKHKKLWAILLTIVLALTTVLGPIPAVFGEDEPEVSAPPSASSITAYTNKWSVVPATEHSAAVDGVLDEALWEEAVTLDDFRTIFNNEQTEDHTEVKLAYDHQHLYIGLDYTSADGGASLANFSFLLSTNANNGPYYEIPVQVRRVSPPYTNEWGTDTVTVAGVSSEIQQGDNGVTVEVAVPLSGLGVTEVSAGDEWQFNAIVQHEMQTKPLESWMPFRTAEHWHTGASRNAFRANVTDQGRLGSLFMSELPEGHEAWHAESLELSYVSFTEKQVTVDVYADNAVETTFSLEWKSPAGSWQAIDQPQIEQDEEQFTITFEHPAPLEAGQYQLRIAADPGSGQESLLTNVTFDRRAMMQAGDELHRSQSSDEGEKEQVTLEEPSAEVAKLLELIPEKTGFIFVGLPDHPDLHPNNLFTWDPEQPDILTSTHSELTWPNEQYPEDQVLTAINSKGEVVEYPYYENEDGKRFFLTAHIWYKQKDHVTRQLKQIANEDPLGAARLLHRFAEVYEGWVPTNEYPWHNEPVNIQSGPPYYYWGGMWYRWGAAELGTNFTHVVEAYDIVKDTDAFELLSQEVGENVKDKIVDEMIKPSIDYFESLPLKLGNMGYYNALGYAALGKAFDDPSYVHSAVEWTEGQANSMFLFDGFFKETTLSYHNQTVNGLSAILAALKGWSDPASYVSPRTGRNLVDLDMLDEFPILKSAANMPRLLAYPNGSYFPTQDTWAFEKSSNPDVNAGAFLLPASGIARLARGTVADTGIFYDFASLDVVDQSVEFRNISGTIQLEANEADHYLTYSFDVPETDTYVLELKPFRAVSYGQYDVLIDGQKVADVEFYAPTGGVRDLEYLAEVELSAGTHEITFQNTGKNEASSNYKMGIIQLALLNEEALQYRDDPEANQQDPTQMYLNFNPKYGHHHWDPLGITLFDEGQELLPDLGYTHTFYYYWSRSTLAHNTVVVDAANMQINDENQSAHGGNVDVFAPINDEVQVVRANQESAYAQTDVYTREPWMIQFPDAEKNEGYLLDLFRVSGGDRHEYTLQGDANHDAVFETDVTMSEYGPYLLPEGVEVREPETQTDPGSAEGHYYGYIYVRDVEKGDVADGRYDLTLRTSDNGEAKANMQITGLVEAGQNELFLGESPSLKATRLHGLSMDTNEEAVKHKMPKMVLRREGSNLTSNFITAMEPFASDGTPRIENVERLTPSQSVEGDLAVKVTYGNTTDIILSSLDPDQTLVVDDMSLDGKMGLIRLVDGEVTNMYLVGGTSLKKGNLEVTDEGPVSGTVTDVHRQAAFDDQNAFIIDTAVPSHMEGQTIVVTHPDGKTHGYEIKEISDFNGQTMIVIDEEPGFTFHPDGTSEMMFTPFTVWSGETTFRVENIAFEMDEGDDGNGDADEVNVSFIQERIAQLNDEGAFANEQAVRVLTMHLTAVGQFEKQGAFDKVTRHMDGFNLLLDQQLDREWITSAAYEILKSDAEALVRSVE